MAQGKQITFTRERGILVHPPGIRSFLIGRIDWFGDKHDTLGFMCSKNWITFDEVEAIYKQMKELKKNEHHD